MRYSCSPQHQGSALYPVISQLMRAAGISRGSGGTDYGIVSDGTFPNAGASNSFNSASNPDFRNRSVRTLAGVWQGQGTSDVN
jgi:hypothetical protein